MKYPTLQPLSAIVLATVLQSSLAYSTPPLRTVALVGDQAPGASSGINFSAFLPPVLNDAGQTAFLAGLSGSAADGGGVNGIWSEGSGELKLVARVDTQAAGAPDGTNYVTFRPPLLNNQGHVAFAADISSDTHQSISGAVYLENSSGLTLIAQTNGQAGGLPNGVTYTGVNLPLLNEANEVSFQGGYRGGIGQSFTSGEALWASQGGNVAVLARQGTSAPGFPAGTNFSNFGLSTFQYAFSNAGAAFSSSVTSGEHGVWQGEPGNLRLVARSGATAPDTTASFALFYRVGTNNIGQVALRGVVTGPGVSDANGEAIWAERPNGLALVARAGDPAPGMPSGVRFDNFYDNLPTSDAIALNDSGHLAFRAATIGSGLTTANNVGIWSDASGSLSLTARTGNQAPGTAAGVTFSSLLAPALNNAGQVAFIATLTGSGVTLTNNTGIWATDRSGALHLVARTGTQLELAPGQFSTVTSLAFSPADVNGRLSGFNNLGQIAFSAQFSGVPAQGVFVSNVAAVPEPAIPSLLGAAAIWLYGRTKKTNVCEEAPDVNRT